MAGNNRKSGIEPEGAGPSEEELAARRRAFDERLDREIGSRRKAREAAEKDRPDNSGFGAALRLSSEFVSAVLVGAAIGWGIDRFFGVAPWGMIVFLLLGFCAGVMNVLRATGSKIGPDNEPTGVPARDLPADDEDDD